MWISLPQMPYAEKKNNVFVALDIQSKTFCCRHLIVEPFTPALIFWREGQGFNQISEQERMWSYVLLEERSNTSLSKNSLKR